MDCGRILLVDDEPQIIRGLTPALVAEGYAVETANTGEGALRRLALDPYDLVVLDLGLPDLDGKSVVTRMRNWCATPVIILSARQMESEKIAALDAGADGYINKPVGLDELMARIRRQLLGHERRGAREPRMRVGDLDVDALRREVLLQGDLVDLTSTEFDMVDMLARFAGSVVTHRQAIMAVWGLSEQVDAQSVRALVAQLRQKIESEPSRPRLLLTEAGAGYRLVAAGTGD